MPHVASYQRLSASRSSLLVIDLQEKLLPVIPSGDNVLRQALRLTEAAKHLGVPFAATVQYPKGLGPLDASLRDDYPEPEAKLDFSAAVCRNALDPWAADGRDQIVIIGIETHVCVLQTVLDLIAEGMRPFVVAEGVAARHGRDHEIAMDRMRDAGATLITTESVMFEWLGSASHPQFKAISKIVKQG